MSEALVKLDPTALAKGGQGINFGSKLFALTPATVSINQPMTQAEGAIPGKLRISETGDQFDSMRVVLLTMPVEQRSFYAGEAGQLNRTPENLMCFSRDMERPDAKAKVPQAMRCQGCPKASWEPWRTKFEKSGIKDPKLIPPCDAYYYALFIDQVYKMPLAMYIRGNSKSPFESAMKNLSRKFAMMKSQGHNPNIFDLSFVITTEKGKSGGKISANYVLKIDNSTIKVITDEERSAFGDVYLQFINRGVKSVEEQAAAEAEAQIENQAAAIDAQVVEAGSETNAVTGEIVL
jgi:hypothetical protein